MADDDASSNGNTTAEAGPSKQCDDPNPDADPKYTRTSLHHSLLGPSLTKSGQDGVDQSKVSEIIYNASRGSRYFEHEQKRDAELTLKIEAMLEKMHKLEIDLWARDKERREADAKLEEMEKTRDLTQTIVHVDCDAFYASVEELDRPELKEVPFVVGGGIVTTANYIARKYGVRSAMAGYIAKKICPNVVFVKPNFDKYIRKSNEIQKILRDYDERYEAASLDEAFINITVYLQKLGEKRAEEALEPPTSAEVVADLRKRVHDATHLTISAGIGPNAVIAKISSNMNKPNGQFIVENDKEKAMEFMKGLPIRKVNGVGRVLERRLAAIGIVKCGDVFEKRDVIRSLFGDITSEFLLHIYLGLGRTEIIPVREYPRKSVGTEATFEKCAGRDALKTKLRETAERLEVDCEHAGKAGRMVMLKVKTINYVVYTRQKPCGRAVYKANDTYGIALPMLRELEDEFRPLEIRLLGLRVCNVVDLKHAKPDMEKFWGGGKKRKREANESNSERSTVKVKVDEDGWEVWPQEVFDQIEKDQIESLNRHLWPEEQFEQMQRDELDEEFRISQELVEEEEAEVENKKWRATRDGSREPKLKRRRPSGSAKAFKQRRSSTTPANDSQQPMKSSASPVPRGSQQTKTSKLGLKEAKPEPKLEPEDSDEEYALGTQVHDSQASNDNKDITVCPVCETAQPADDVMFNAHLDFCLSKSAIRKAVQDTRTKTVSPEETGALQNANRAKTPGVSSSQNGKGKGPATTRTKGRTKARQG